MFMVARLLALRTSSYVDCGFFPADACGLLCAVSPGPRGRLLLSGARIRSDTEADIQRQPSLLPPVHHLCHRTGSVTVMVAFGEQLRVQTVICPLLMSAASPCLT